MDNPARIDQRRAPRRLASAVFVAALLLRLVALAVHPWTDDGDQQLYRSLAHNLATGSGYVDATGSETGVHPCLPVLVAIVSLACPDDRVAGLIVTLVIGALVPAVAAWFIASAFGMRAGALAGAILALEPHHVLSSARLEPDLLSAALGFLLSGMLVSGTFVWAGVVIAAGYLNRPEALLWLPAAIAWAKWSGAAWRPVLRMIFVAALLAAPFVVYVRWFEGRWALSGKDRWTYMQGVHQYRSGNQPLERERAPQLMREVGSPLDHLRARPQEFVRGYLYRSWLLLENLGRQTGYGLLVPFAVVGLVVGLRSTREATLALLVPLVTVPLLPLVMTFVRHSQIPAAVILALAALGIAHGGCELVATGPDRGRTGGVRGRT